jgi:hypothetical protein
MCVSFFYIFQLKEYQQKSRYSQHTGIKTSGKKSAPKFQLEAGSLEQNSVFDSGPVSPEHSEVCSTVRCS